MSEQPHSDGERIGLIEVAVILVRENKVPVMRFMSAISFGVYADSLSVFIGAWFALKLLERK